MRVTAVVVTWDARDDIAGCIAAIDAQDHPGLDLVVVDNASRDGTADVVERLLAAGTRHPARLLRLTENRGFCGGVNAALAVSDADAVLLVNPDARPAADLTTRALAVLAAHPRCGSVQPRVLRPRGDALVVPDAPSVSGVSGARGWVLDTTGHVLTRPRLVRNRGEGLPDDGRWSAGPVFGASGAVVVHRRAMLDDVAWRRADGTLEHLTEDLVAYFDDVELDYRAASRGWQARYEPGAVAVHRRGGVRRGRAARIEALSWSNRLMVVLGMEAPSRLLVAAPAIVATTVVITLELALTRPTALPGALARLRLLPAAVRRGRIVRARALVPMGAVADRWVEPLDVREWVTTWWRRMRPRPGIDDAARGGRSATR
jgi:GT2 family glycosyltransferase